ncbi:70 kDa peptidyl-prolyl isomerase [Bienertia sinuspersici]
MIKVPSNPHNQHNPTASDRSERPSSLIVGESLIVASLTIGVASGSFLPLEVLRQSKLSSKFVGRGAAGLSAASGLCSLWLNFPQGLSPSVVKRHPQASSSVPRLTSPGSRGATTAIKVLFLVVMGSINLCLELQKDLKDLLFDVRNLEKQDPDLFRFVSTLENPKGVLEHSSNFKDEGNSSFKEGDFENALEKYSLSCVFLSCLDVQEEDARSSFSHLASIVILNMAACLLKKKEFEHVGQLCSIVLNYNPKNVKALFRRANAAIGLGEYELACWDLRVAQETESSNQEVGRKLKEVEQILHARPGKCNVQGKKKRLEKRLQEASEPIAPIDDSMANEKVSKQDERENPTCNDIDISNMMEVDKSGGRAIENDADRVKETPSTKEVVMSDQEKTEGVRVIGMVRKKKVDRSKVHFQNKRKPESGLTISSRDYQLLAKGRTVQHFNPRLGIVLSIRVLGTPQEHLYKISESHTQQTPQSYPRHQGELFHHKGVDDSATHDVIEQSERNLVREISPSSPEKVTRDYPSEVTPMLIESPSYPPILFGAHFVFQLPLLTTVVSLFIQLLRETGVWQGGHEIEVLGRVQQRLKEPTVGTQLVS